MLATGALLSLPFAMRWARGTIIGMDDIPVRELEAVARLMSFYSHLGRGLTLEEVWRLLPKSRQPDGLASLVEILEALERAGFLERHDDIWGLRHRAGVHADCLDFAERRRTLQRIQKEKWRLLKKRARRFRRVPFLEFAIVSGSMALGSAAEYSDFDAVLGCRRGRIFTVRFFAHLIFTLGGAGRRAGDSKQKSKDKFCFAHFMTPAGYRLSGPHTFAWEEIYRNLVPVYGQTEAVEDFFRVNGWAERAITPLDWRWIPAGRSFLRSALELLLGGFFGDGVEKILRFWQIRRINQSRKFPAFGLDHPNRLYVSDEELEFHGRERDFRKIMAEVEELVSGLRTALY